MIGTNNFINECKKDKITYKEYIVINNTTVEIKAKTYFTAYKDTTFFGTFNLNYIKFITPNNISYRNKDFVYYKVVNGISQKIGHYYVTEVVDNDTEEEVEVTGFDNGIKFNNKYVTELNYSGGNVTLFNVLQECCTKCGVTLKNQSITNGSFIVDSNQFESGATYGDVISAIAQMAGGFAFINYEGKLVIRFTNTTNEVIEDYVDLDDKRDTRPITSVLVGLSPDIDGEYAVREDSALVQQYGRNWLKIYDNPFSYTAGKREQLIDAIYNQVKGFGYSSFTSKDCFAPYFELGDLVQFKNKAGQNVSSIVLRIETEYDEITVSAPSETDASVEYIKPTTDNEIARNTQIIVDKEKQRIDSIVTQIGDRSQKTTTITQDVDGINTEVSSIQDDLTNNYSTTSQTATMISNTVAEEFETAVADNLVYNSVGAFGINSWGESTSGILSSVERTEAPSVSKRAIQIETTATSAKWVYTPRFEIKAGETYTISGYVYLSQYCTSVDIMLFSSNTETADYPYKYQSADVNKYNDSYYALNPYSTKSTWYYFSKTITFGSSVKSAFIRFGHNGSSRSGTTARAYLSDLMVVKGEVAKSWGVSNKDTQSNSSSIVQTAYDVSMKLDSSSFTSAAVIGLINNRDGTSTAKIEASNINLVGYVTATSLSTAGSTTINGSNITTGIISASRLDTSTINATNGTIGGFTISSNVIQSDSAGFSSNEYYAFWTKINGGTTYFVTWNGDIVCSSIRVGGAGSGGAGGNPLVKSVDTSGQFITQIKHAVSYMEYYVDGVGAFGVNCWQSDTKLKKNIADTELNGLDFVNQLRHVQFDWKRDDKHVKIGYLANEIKEIDKDVIIEIEQPEDSEFDSLLQIDETKLIPYLSKAIQEEDSKVDELDKRIKKIEKILEEV